MNKYIATGNVITNRIIFTDKRVVEGIMGGHGLYAHEGISLGTDNCIFVASVGKDFDEYYGKWFDDNHMSKEGLKFNLERCNYNEVVYAEDGQFIEYSIYGPEEEEKNRALSYMTCDDIEPFLEGTKGIYSMFLFDKERFCQQREKYGFKYMWEYTPSVLKESGKDAVMDYIAITDIYSLNRPESYALFGVDNEEAAIAEIQNLGKPCYYRVGSKGAYMVNGKDVAFVPIVHVVSRDLEIDPTGCGNSSTAGALWAFAEGFDTLMTCIWGNVVAGFNSMQYGPKLVINNEVRKQARKKAEELYKELNNRWSV